ncbi:EF-P beta-lysylation protein EpmB [Arhodomonas aquaeolei]|uniref:EF-P beta-lysylation protein EpmB n=1 Tax=Arhodomonas aquaeolei TaxID=2369 RepID=UPI0021693061|nr:EF-P beta-lysylation protein EpmB [Arhodomonas aquaeolei]MCS4504404.1 EF-P beta-lysylation protein EpmB [Arhodomonas aquaeolei]
MVNAQAASTTTRSEPPAWQRALADAIRDPRELLDTLALPHTLLDGARTGAALFPLRVPRGYAARMRRGDPDDPLLRQVLPVAAEARSTPGFVDDPVGDLDVVRPGGILHKYRGRALIVATGACAVNCRYCFRRAFPYSEHQAAPHQWREALDTLRGDPSIEEVILSGGDPLSLSDRRLAALAEGLAGIGRVRRLRVHTRLPVVLPERVDDGLLDWLAGTRLAPVMVIHANHPAELDGDVAAALARLRENGVTLLNQTVLLRGVNDAVATLAALSERLFEQGVMPYYLHLLDPVRGAGHFDVDEREAAGLMRGLADRLPGYLVPRLVREVPGRSAKTHIAWDTAPP